MPVTVAMLQRCPLTLRPCANCVGDIIICLHCTKAVICKLTRLRGLHIDFKSSIDRYKCTASKANSFSAPLATGCRPSKIKYKKFDLSLVVFNYTPIKDSCTLEVQWSTGVANTDCTDFLKT